MAKKQPAAPLTPEQAAKKKAENQAKRQEAFKRLAVKRVNKAIKSLSLVANLANYKPTIEQAAIIEKALVSAHNTTVGRLKGTTTATQEFSL
jgi:hypothetical protein